MSQSQATIPSAQDAPSFPPQAQGDERPVPAKQEADTPAKPIKKVFTLNDVKRVIEVPIHWPAVYPGYEPWVFKFRLALSAEVEKKRQEWLGMTDAEANETEKFRANVLEQICDLLVEHPTGFGDLGTPENLPHQSPALVFHSYVKEASKDPEQKETLYRILIAAYNGYLGRALPQSFRQEI
jgi:hypothetical protein